MQGAGTSPLFLELFRFLFFFFPCSLDSPISTCPTQNALFPVLGSCFRWDLRVLRECPPVLFYYESERDDSDMLQGGKGEK